MASIKVSASASISKRLGLIFIPTLLLPKGDVPAYETVPDLVRRGISSGLSLCRLKADMIGKQITHGQSAPPRDLRQVCRTAANLYYSLTFKYAYFASEPSRT